MLKVMACAALLLLSLGVGPGVATPAAALQLAAADTAMSLEAAAAKVQRAHGGRVVSAAADDRGSRPGYRIRLLQKDGRVLTFWVDARTGAIRRGG